MERRVLFSVHEYDQDGDISERGVFLHFGETRIKAGETLAEFKQMVANITHIVEEIEENYRGL